MSAKWLTLLAVCSCCAFAGPALGGEHAKQITVVFRYDDYANDTTQIEFDRRLIDAFKANGLCATVAAIPFQRVLTEGERYDAIVPTKVLPLNDQKAGLLADAIRDGTLEVALHGYVHREVNAAPPWTEFAGVPAAEQQRRISAGKALLEKKLGTEITVFVPPFNSYDAATIQVLERLGFETLSAGGLPVPPGTSTLQFLPTSCHRICDLRSAITSARKSAESDPLIVVMFHPHDFIELGDSRGAITFEDFAELLRWVAAQEDVQVRTLGAVAAEDGDELTLSRYRQYCALRPDKTKRLLPGFLQQGYSKLYYYPTRETLGKVKLGLALRFAAWYGLIGAGTFLAVYLVLGIFPALARLAAYSTLLVLVGLLIHACRDFELYYRGASLLACVGGACAAAWTVCCRGSTRTCRQLNEMEPVQDKPDDEPVTPLTADPG